MDDILAFATARGTSRANLTAGWLDGGTVKIYDGTRPATPNTAVTTQHLLVTFTLPDPSGTVEDGVWTAGSIAMALITTGGIASWARAADSSGAVIGDGDASATGSGALVEISNVTLVQGAYVAVTSFTLTEG